MKQKLKTILVALVVLLILMNLLRIKPVRDTVSKVTGIDGDTLAKIPVAATFLVLGLALFAVAGLLAASPILAGVALIAGLISIGWSVYNWYNPPGQKPENVSLGEKM